MIPKGLLLGIFLTVSTCSGYGAGIFPENAQRTTLHNDLPFFRRIQQLNLDWDDIVGQYRNVSAEVETEMCKNKCKTAIAFWVLQSLKPCDNIEKLDCPKGLLCCSYTSEVEAASHGPTQSPEEVELALVAAEKRPPSVAANDDDPQHWVDPEPILDPIPEEEPKKLENTELDTS